MCVCVSGLFSFVGPDDFVEKKIIDLFSVSESDRAILDKGDHKL